MTSPSKSRDSNYDQYRSSVEQLRNQFFKSAAKNSDLDYGQNNNYMNPSSVPPSAKMTEFQQIKRGE